MRGEPRRLEQRCGRFVRSHGHSSSKRRGVQCASRLPLSPPSQVPQAALRRTGAILDLLAPALAVLMPETFPGSGVPAVVHQTWKADDVGEEEDFKAQMDGWEGGGGPGGGRAWRHVVWSDARLNRLIGTAAPWLAPTLRRMRPDVPVDKIDTMRCPPPPHPPRVAAGPGDCALLFSLPPGPSSSPPLDFFFARCLLASAPVANSFV